MIIAMLLLFIGIALLIVYTVEQSKHVEDRNHRCDVMEVKCNISQVGKNCTIALLIGDVTCEYSDCIADSGTAWSEKTCYFDHETNKCPTTNCEVEIESMVDTTSATWFITMMVGVACGVLSVVVGVTINECLPDDDMDVASLEASLEESLETSLETSSTTYNSDSSSDI